MSFDKKIESFIYLGKNKISISVFSKKDYLIFKKEFLTQKNYLDLDHNVYKFLEKAILEFESKNQIFLKKINIITDNDNFLEINVSIKNKINKQLITKEDIEYLIFDLKKLVQNDNSNYLIINIKIKNFRVDEKYYQKFDEIQTGDNLILEVMFESINKEVQLEIKNFFSKLEVDIERYFSTNSLKINILNKKMDESAAAAKYIHDYDQNEVFLISKNKEKLSFFEKLFHILSR